MRNRLRARLGAFVDRRIDERFATDLSLPARMLPTDPTARNRVTPSPTPTDAATPADFPVPPDERREGSPDYLGTGREHTDNLREAVARAGVTIEGNVLDFGCASGRLTRWFLDEAREAEVWGTDFNADHIAWSQAHLSPPFRFTMCTSLPALPFDDGYFGLTMAGSVFTHISELEDAWLLELRRVTRPGGLLYLTIQDQSFIDRTLETAADNWIGALLRDNAEVIDQLGRGLDTVAIERALYESMVFHDREALLRRWSTVADVLDVAEAAYYDQTAILLRRPV